MVYVATETAAFSHGKITTLDDLYNFHRVLHPFLQFLVYFTSEMSTLLTHSSVPSVVRR